MKNCIISICFSFIIIETEILNIYYIFRFCDSSFMSLDSYSVGVLVLQFDLRSSHNENSKLCLSYLGLYFKLCYLKRYRQLKIICSQNC